jgi:hypothetical protein
VFGTDFNAEALAGTSDIMAKEGYEHWTAQHAECASSTGSRP